MNVAVVVEGCSAASGVVTITLHICTSSGQDYGADVLVDFAASATVMRSNITDRARRVLVDAGVPGAATAIYRLFGGPA